MGQGFSYRSQNVTARIFTIGSAIGFFWFLFIGGFLLWEVNSQKQMVTDLAAAEARASFNRDLVYRRWSAMHGGTYVPATEQTPPSPYLKHIAERDIVTPSGRPLTLVNPAYMTRQVHELGQEQYGVKGHITSLNPIRPENRPDEWEQGALEKMEQGAREISTITRVDGAEYLRLMLPMITENGCLKCHGYQRYKVGDVRGGISVSVPLDRYRAIAEKKIIHSIFIHLAIFLTGLMGLGTAFFYLNRKSRERDVMEQALREREEHLMGIFNAAENVAIVTTDLQGGNTAVTEFSPGAEKIFGYTKDEILGEKLALLHLPEDVAKFPEFQKELKRSGIGFSGETRLVRKGGEYFPALLTIYPWTDGSGNLVGTIGVTIDISGQKDVENELNKSKERFELAMNAGQDGLYDWDLVKSEIYYSPGWKRMLGYEERELPNDFSVWERLIHPEDVNRSWLMQQELVTKERDRFELEFRMRHKQGHWVDILSRATAIFNDLGQAVRIVGTHVDITERKRAAHEIQAAKEMFEKVFNSQTDAIFILSAGVPAVVLACNKAAAEMFGCQTHELIGYDARHLHVDDDHLNTFQENLLQSIEQKGALEHFSFTMKRKDGSVFPSEHTVLELRDEAGNRTGWVSIVRDLTERKEMEERILQAQKMESIGNLAGGIAHDFNNILFPIVGMAELLMEDLSPDSLEYDNAQEILKAGTRGSKLVKQILAFSRQTEHKMMPVRVQQVLKEVMKLSRATIPANIELHKDIDPDCGLVNADPTQIHQVAMNLITNAFHAVEKKGGGIMVSLFEQECSGKELKETALDPGKYLVLEVTDTGTGIEPQVQKKIFEPYFTTKELGKGTGLGLAMVYGIVKEHKGDIRLSSEPGKGTTFSVYLPLIEKVSGKISDPRASIPIARENEQLLLVDDDPSVAVMQRQILERLGYRVKEFTSSEVALEAFKQDPQFFDLVITDMTMPKMTGDELASEILGIRPDIPVIVCTGYSDRLNREEAKEMGIKGFLMKPIVKSEMAELIRTLLDRAEPG